VIAASDKVLDKASSEISDLVSIIQFAASQFVKLPNAIQLLSKRYEQKQEDIENWFHSTEWSSSSDVSEKMLKNVIHFLKKASLIEDSHTFEYKKIVKEIKRDK
jgi:sulfonate transport system substrate-binding protein